jgi:gluconolactonase
VIDPQTLKVPRGGGKIIFAWYRTWLTIPSKIGDFDPTGAKVALVVTVDDYAEVSVNGQMPRAVGHTSPATIQGFNMPNRVLLSDSVKPGDKFEIAILGINGPISLAPSNFVFFRQASVEFFKATQ